MIRAVVLKWRGVAAPSAQLFMHSSGSAVESVSAGAHRRVDVTAALEMHELGNKPARAARVVGQPSHDAIMIAAEHEARTVGLSVSIKQDATT